MSESCPGCFTSAKGQQQEYSIKRTEAIKWLNDNKKSVALYQEGYNVLFMEAESAVNTGMPIKEIITYQPE